MARELHRDRPAISREIRRNGWQGPAGRRCRAPAAQRKADRRRLRCRPPRLMDEPGRRSLAVRPMRDGHWSPEEISGRIPEGRPGLAASDSAICRAVEPGSPDCGFRGTGRPRGCSGTMESVGTGREARSAGARCC
jgi:IS30 family transposase